MKKLALVIATFALAACQSDNRNIEKKIDELNKKVDSLIAGGGARGAAGQQRPSRPEPKPGPVPGPQPVPQPAPQPAPQTCRLR